MGHSHSPSLLEECFRRKLLLLDYLESKYNGKKLSDLRANTRSKKGLLPSALVLGTEVICGMTELSVTLAFHVSAVPIQQPEPGLLCNTREFIQYVFQSEVEHQQSFIPV